MEIIFMGTPDFSLGVLEALHEHHHIIGVYTQPDRRRGRGGKLSPSPVKALALDLGLKVYTPERLEQEDLKRFKACDLCVVVAYGKILPKAFLQAPTYGCLNIHASLLPRYRGASPIVEAILQGDKQTGITYMLMDEAMDTGDILEQETLDIQGLYLDEVHDGLAQMSKEGIIRVLRHLPELIEKKRPQDHSQASYTHKRHNQDAKINWHQSTQALMRHIRGFSPIPGAYTFLEGQRLKILKARPAKEVGLPGEVIKAEEELIIATEDSSLVIDRLQPAGKKAMDTEAFLRGRTISKKTRLGG